MSGPQTIERRKVFERLAGAVSLRGWKDFEVTFESEELKVERHGERVSCTVVMLPDEPTFQAHFTFPAMSVRAVSFTIGEEAGDETVPPPTLRFVDIEEATTWLLEFLEMGDRPVERSERSRR